MATGVCSGGGPQQNPRAQERASQLTWRRRRCAGGSRLEVGVRDARGQRVRVSAGGGAWSWPQLQPGSGVAVVGSLPVTGVGGSGLSPGFTLPACVALGSLLTLSGPWIPQSSSPLIAHCILCLGIVCLLYLLSVGPSAWNMLDPWWVLDPCLLDDERCRGGGRVRRRTPGGQRTVGKAAWRGGFPSVCLFPVT